MSIKFYTDSHIPKAVTDQLQGRGVDIVRCQEVGLADAEDLTHLEYATREGRAVVTGDDDFLALDAVWQATGQDHAGIFFIHRQLLQQRRIGVIVSALLFYVEALEAEAATLENDVYNQVVYVSRK